jgi:hypothetical protein
MTNPNLPSDVPKANPGLQEHSQHSANGAQAWRKADLVALADFLARTGRRWLVRDALQAMYREGLMTPALTHIVPACVLDDPAPYIAEALRSDEIWIVADAYDALRLETYGFPALATENTIELTRDHLHDCRWVILLQRPGESETLAGLDVRGELLRLGWTGTLTEIVLPFADLDEAEHECGAEHFGIFLLSRISDARSQQLTGERINAQQCCGQSPFLGARYLAQRMGP